MPTRTLKSAKFAVAVGTWVVLSMTSSAFSAEILDDPTAIEERVTQLIVSSNSLCWEMYRYHQQQPDYQDSYQAAKDLWSQATRLRDSLYTGPMETATLTQNVSQMNETFLNIERSLTKWGAGDQSSVPNKGNSTVQTVVTPGVGLDLPFFNLQVGGGSRVEVINEAQPPLQRIKLHPNAHGSKRSLERELFSVKLALSYLAEDAGTPSPTNASAAVEPNATKPAPQPPRPDSTLSGGETVVPARKSDNR